jgi:hypothetical protein
MVFAAVIIGLVLVLFVLWDGFETIIFPRRVTRKMRLTRLFYQCTWLPWSRLVHLTSSGRRLDTLLSFYGPLSLLFLLSIWAGGLVFGFGLLHWAADAWNRGAGLAQGFGTELYMSGTSFFTLGIGDVTPHTIAGKVLTVVEAGLGLGFLALIIAYLPALNESFGRREASISMLDARAGSPPTAMEMLRRHTHDTGMEDLRRLFFEWERWSAELLESHLSFPVLAYFRSQHDNQSWLSALSAILDTTALVIAGVGGACSQQAELTFAMARHAIVDIAIVFNRPPREPSEDRLTPADLSYLREKLGETGMTVADGAEMEEQLRRLRHMYEPHVHSLAEYLCVGIPRFIPEGTHTDNWQVSGWGQVLPVRDIEEAAGEHKHHHF